MFSPRWTSLRGLHRLHLRRRGRRGFRRRGRGGRGRLFSVVGDVAGLAAPWGTVGHRGAPWGTVGHRGAPWGTVGHRGAPWEGGDFHGFLLGKTEQNPRFYGEISRLEQFWVKSCFEDIN